MAITSGFVIFGIIGQKDNVNKHFVLSSDGIEEVTYRIYIYFLLAPI